MNLSQDFEIRIRPTCIASNNQLHFLEVPEGGLRRAYYVQGPPGAYRQIEIAARTYAGILAGLEEAWITLSPFGIFPVEVLKAITVTLPLPSGAVWTGSIGAFYNLLGEEIRKNTRPMFEAAKNLPDAVDYAEAMAFLTGKKDWRTEEITQLQSFVAECGKAIAEIRAEIAAQPETVEK